MTMLLAVATTSGRMPRCSAAKSRPVRATDCTSSQTRRPPVSSQTRRAAWKNAGSPGT